MTARAKPQQMCFMTIGFTRIIIPADKGLKVMELLQHAVEADERYRREDHKYQVNGPLNIELRMVRDSEIVMPEGEIAAPTRAAPKLLKGPA